MSSSSQQSSKSADLFAEPSAPSTFGAWVITAVAIILGFGGLVVMGYAFSYPAYQVWLFLGGFGLNILGFYIAFSAWSPRARRN